MISFNVPPYVGKEKEYVSQAIDNHKICGDGEFTKKCSKWIEENWNRKGFTYNIMYTCNRNGGTAM